MTVTCLRRIVARPKVPFSSAYDSPPTRKKPEVEQPERRGQHPLLGHAALLEVRRRPVSRAIGQALGEGQDPLVLLGVALDPPLVVVAVLPASGRVGAEGLDVPAGVRADPDVLPRRRDHQVGDALRARRGRRPCGRPATGRRSPCRGAPGRCPGRHSRPGAAVPPLDLPPCPVSGPVAVGAAGAVGARARWPPPSQAGFFSPSLSPSVSAALSLAVVRASPAWCCRRRGGRLHGRVGHEGPGRAADLLVARPAGPGAEDVAGGEAGEEGDLGAHGCSVELASVAVAGALPWHVRPTPCDNLCVPRSGPRPDPSRIAQLAEQPAVNRQVSGSSPDAGASRSYGGRSPPDRRPGW